MSGRRDQLEYEIALLENQIFDGRQELDEEPIVPADHHLTQARTAREDVQVEQEDFATRHKKALEELKKVFGPEAVKVPAYEREAQMREFIEHLRGDKAEVDAVRAVLRRGEGVQDDSGPRHPGAGSGGQGRFRPEAC